MLIQRIGYPVIRGVVILTIVITQRCVRVQLEVRTYDTLTDRDGVHIVTHTAILTENSLVCIRMSLCNGFTGIDSRIVERLVSRLHVHARITHHVVGRNGTLVSTPLRIYVYLELRVRTTALGGNQDNTVRTTGTIDSRSGSILQYRNRGDIITTNRVDFTLKRRTVYNVQRGCTTVDRTCTTDTDACARTRLTGTINNLNTCHLTLQCVRYVRLSLVGELFALHLFSRTNELCTSRSTITDNHDFVQHLRVFRQINNYSVLRCYFLSRHTDERNNQYRIRVYRKGELTVDVGNRSSRSTLHLNRCTDDRLVICSVSDGT